MVSHRARAAVVVCCVVSSLLGQAAAKASQPLGDLDVTTLSLAVNAYGEALVTYTRANGQVRHVLAWGAVNARAPDPNVPQVGFQMDYTGGLRKHHNPGYWKRFKPCLPYAGPQL